MTQVKSNSALETMINQQIGIETSDRQDLKPTSFSYFDEECLGKRKED